MDRVQSTYRSGWGRAKAAARIEVHAAPTGYQLYRYPAWPDTFCRYSPPRLRAYSTLA